jgi:hypothetical protein
VTTPSIIVRRAVSADQVALARLLEIARLLPPFALLAGRDGTALGLATLNPVLFGCAFRSAFRPSIASRERT